MKHVITIQGEEITIAMNFATEIAYEQMTGKAFDTSDIFPKKGEVNSGLLAQLALSCIIANNPDSKIDDQFLLHDATRQEVNLVLETTVTSLMEWIAVPAIAEEHVEEPTLAEKEQDPKNA